MTVFIVFVVIVVSVILLKGFDQIAGRGPKQVNDGLQQYESHRYRPSQPDRVPCPHCAELILPAAKKCPFCRSDL